MTYTFRSTRIATVLPPVFQDSTIGVQIMLHHLYNGSRSSCFVHSLFPGIRSAHLSKRHSITQRQRHLSRTTRRIGPITNGLAPSDREEKSTANDSDVVPSCASNHTPRFDIVRYTNPSNWPERFRVVLLCFFSFVICNCDRINISVAILPMAKYYGWSQTTVGIVQSAFFWGYVLTQIPGGYLADKYGGKHVLAAGVIMWSLMTLLTPAAASSNIGVLLLARALLGVGEGVAMPAMNNIISKWVPSGERARSLSLVYSGMYLGSVVGLLLCPTFIVAFGWQSVFYIFGALGFVWWAVWQISTSSSPQASTSISEEERKYIVDSVALQDGNAKKTSRIPWRLLLSKAPTWAIIVAHFCTTWGKNHELSMIM